jgi:hypothetical protein
MNFRALGSSKKEETKHGRQEMEHAGERRQFDAAFKAEAVCMVTEGDYTKVVTPRPKPPGNWALRPRAYYMGYCELQRSNP